MSDRLTVLTSKSVFTGTGDLPFEGFVAVRGNRIEAVGAKCEAASYLTQADEVVDLGDRTIMPGLIDVHTFYTGWALRTLGSDLSGIADAKEAVSLLRAWKEDHSDCAAAFGHNLPETLASDAENANTAAVLDDCFGDIPVVCFTPGAETCVLNAAAQCAIRFYAPGVLFREDLAHDERFPRAARGACRVFGLHEHA